MLSLRQADSGREQRAGQGCEDTRPWQRQDMGYPKFAVVRSRRFLSLWVRK